MNEDNVKLLVISIVAELELPEHKGLGPPQCQHWVLGEGQSGMLLGGRTVRNDGISHRQKDDFLLKRGPPPYALSPSAPHYRLLAANCKAGKIRGGLLNRMGYTAHITLNIRVIVGPFGHDMI